MAVDIQRDDCPPARSVKAFDRLYPGHDTVTAGVAVDGSVHIVSAMRGRGVAGRHTMETAIILSPEDARAFASAILEMVGDER